MRRVRGLAVVVALVAMSACGGGNGSPVSSQGEEPAAGSGEPQEAISVNIADAAAKLEARWGDEGAFYVIAWALDRGYTLAQVVEGAQGNLIDADGSIRSDTGTPVTPGQEPAGLLSVVEALAPRFVLAAMTPPLLSWGRDESPAGAYVERFDITLGQIFEAAETQSREQQVTEELANLALLLAGRGYSLEQILESMYNGTYRNQLYNGVNCWFVGGEHGPVKPDLPPFDPLHELSCPAASEASTTTTSSSTSTTSTPVEDPSGGDGVDGRYVGALDETVFRGFDAIPVNEMEITITDGEVAGLSFDFAFVHASVIEGAESTVLCVAETGFRAEIGPNVITLDGTTLSGSFSAVEYQTFGEGPGCREDLVKEDPVTHNIRATIEGNIISGDIGQDDVGPEEVGIQFTLLNLTG